MSFALASLAMLALGAAFGAQAARAGFSPTTSICLTAMALLQAVVAWLAVCSPAPLFLALFALAIGASGLSFLQRGSVRDVLSVGGSLAGVQAAVPMGGMVAALLIPVLAGWPRQSGPLRHAGLYAILCFLPVLAAVGLACFARLGHSSLLAALHVFPAGALPSRHVPSRIIRVLMNSASLIVLAPAAIAVRRERAAAFALLVGVALVTASVAAALIGAIRHPAGLVAPLAATALLAVCRGANARAAMAAAAAGLVLAGAYVLAVPYAWAM